MTFPDFKLKLPERLRPVLALTVPALLTVKSPKVVAAVRVMFWGLSWSEPKVNLPAVILPARFIFPLEVSTISPFLFSRLLAWITPVLFIRLLNTAFMASAVKRITPPSADNVPVLVIVGLVEVAAGTMALIMPLESKVMVVNLPAVRQIVPDWAIIVPEFWMVLAKSVT